MLICLHEQTHIFSETHSSLWHSVCHCFASLQSFYFGKSNAALDFLWKAHTAPRNQWSELSKPVPVISPSIRLSDVCFRSDTHKVFLGQSTKEKEGMCGSKEYPMRFKPGSSLSCPKDMNFLFSPVSLKALPCKQEQHKKKKIRLLEN